MKRIIAGTVLVLSLSACGTSPTDPDTLDVSGTITEMEFERGSSSCMMALKAPAKPAPAAPKPVAPRPVVVAPVPAKPASTAKAATSRAAGTYRPAQGPIPTQSYKSRKYVVWPYSGSNRCYRSDCWEIEFQTAGGQEFDVCVSKDVYDSYHVGDPFPGGR